MEFDHVRETLAFARYCWMAGLSTEAMAEFDSAIAQETDPVAQDQLRLCRAAVAAGT